MLAPLEIRSIPHLRRARAGEWAQLSATFTGPGSQVFGVPIEFLFSGQVVATAETDGTGTAHPPTTSFDVPGGPGEYPDAITVRLGAGSGFFVANEAVPPSFSRASREGGSNAESGKGRDHATWAVTTCNSGRD